ncbi:hypothetical protein AB6A40_000187 [Gnathostoma spinigerum]|uniref:Saposin B-type domain-containing protein n=1 Tax=Gnathostoma spinigerum TaxID=75299 RepID=A0ABD6E1N1_9BILA
MGVKDLCKYGSVKNMRCVIFAVFLVTASAASTSLFSKIFKFDLLPKEIWCPVCLNAVKILKEKQAKNPNFKKDEQASCLQHASDEKEKENCKKGFTEKALNELKTKTADEICKGANLCTVIKDNYDYLKEGNREKPDMSDIPEVKDREKIMAAVDPLEHFNEIFEDENNWALKGSGKNFTLYFKFIQPKKEKKEDSDEIDSLITSKATTTPEGKSKLTER